MRLATKDYKKHAAKNSSCEKINEKLEKVTFSSTRDYKDFLGKKNVAKTLFPKKEKWQDRKSDLFLCLGRQELANLLARLHS